MELNCLYAGKAEIILKGFDENFFDLVVTSPPYDNLRNYNKTLNDVFNFEGVAKELYRVLKKNGVIVWVIGDACINRSETCTSFRQAIFFVKLGFKLHDTMIYEKNGASFPARKDSNRYSQIFEYMFVLSKDGPPKTANLICDKQNRWAGYTSFGKANYRNKDGKQIERKIKPVPEFSPRNNIWRYNTGMNYSTKDKVAFKHPAIFPEELAKDHIISWSNEGDIILDPFCGSGTTCKMAKILNRNFVGIDVVEEYLEIADQRLKLLD